MELRRIWCLIIVTGFILTGCGSSNGQEQWTKYSGEAYEFDYPKSWTTASPDELGITPTPELVLYAPSPDSDFAANVNMVIQVHPLLAPSAQEQADATTQFFDTLGEATGVKDYKQIDFLPIELGNINAGVSTNEFTMSQNNIAVKNQQLFVPLGQKSYILTLGCKKDDWATHESDFQKIINSFRLKN